MANHTVHAHVMKRVRAIHDSQRFSRKGAQVGICTMNTPAPFPGWAYRSPCLLNNVWIRNVRFFTIRKCLTNSCVKEHNTHGGK